MFRCTAKLPMSPEKLIKNLQDRDNLTKWNKTVTSYKILKVLVLSFKISNILLLPFALLSCLYEVKLFCI